jgi:hypothetical protein
MREPPGMMVMISDVCPFHAHVPLTAGVGLVAPGFQNVIVFDLNFEPAILCAQGAAGFFPITHIDSPIVFNF